MSATKSEIQIEGIKIDTELENIIFYAFRYALGRKSSAPFDVTNFIQDNWNNLTRHTQQQMRKEIREAIEMGAAGMPMDERLWERIYDLPLTGL